MDTNIKILILEDSKDDVKLILRELNKSEIHFSSEVVQAREEYENMLDKFTPDIILADYSLPEFDGVTAFNIKQNKNPLIPFIMVSGVIGEENAVELIKTGITDYVLKDKLNVLNQKIDRALKATKEIKEKISVIEKLKIQNSKLFEIAFLQSHQVRGPITNILGLIELFNHDDPSDPINSEIITKLHQTTIEFDSIIHKVVQNTKEIKDLLQ